MYICSHPRTAFGTIETGSLGADCASLGINLSNSTDHAASPPNLPDNGSTSAAGGKCGDLSIEYVCHCQY